MQWQVLGGLWEEYPAATTDGLGRVVVMVKGPDNRLYMQREVSAGDIGSFVGWTQVGD